NLRVVTERGMGKCSPIDEYRVQKRGGKGIITVHRTDKTGDAVSLMEVLPDDELMLITKHGVAIRMPVKGIRVAGRNTQGVKLVNLDNDDLVMDVARVVPDDESEAGDDGPGRGRRGIVQLHTERRGVDVDRHRPLFSFVRAQNKRTTDSFGQERTGTETAELPSTLFRCLRPVRGCPMLSVVEGPRETLRPAKPPLCNTSFPM